MDRAGFTLAAVGDVALLRRPGRDLLRDGWDTADLRIANVEAPLSEGGVPAVKLIRLQSPPEAARWVRANASDTARSSWRAARDRARRVATSTATDPVNPRVRNDASSGPHGWEDDLFAGL